MLRRHFKLPKKDIGISQIAVGSSLCCPVAKFFGYEEALLDETDRR